MYFKLDNKSKIVSLILIISLKYPSLVKKYLIILQIKVIRASEKYLGFVQQICNEMEISALKRGTGIAKRSAIILRKKIWRERQLLLLIKRIFGMDFAILNHGNLESMQPIQG